MFSHNISQAILLSFITDIWPTSLSITLILWVTMRSSNSRFLLSVHYICVSKNPLPFPVQECLSKCSIFWHFFMKTCLLQNFSLQDSLFPSFFATYPVKKRLKYFLEPHHHHLIAIFSGLAGNVSSLIIFGLKVPLKNLVFLQFKHILRLFLR